MGLINARVGVLAVLLAAALFVVVQREPAPHQFTPLDVDATAAIDVAYGDQPRNRLDVYLPAGPGPHPTVVWIHGGGWVAGDKSSSMPVWDWTARGYAVVSINYRYAVAPTTVLDSVADAIAAVSFIIDNTERWALDPERIGVYGFSAGGHLAAMVAQSGLDIAAVAVAASPTDFSTLVDPSASVFEARPSAEAAAVIRSRLGCSESACDAAVAAASPALLDAGLAPMLIVHGAIDTIVDPAQARSLHDRLRSQGANPEILIVDGAGHAPFVDHGVTEFLDGVLLGS